MSSGFSFISSAPLNLLNLRHYPVTRSSRYMDIFRVEGRHPFNFVADVVAVKAPHAALRDIGRRSLQTIILDRVLWSTAANEFVPARICQLFISNVVLGGEVVRAAVYPWFDNGNVLEFVNSNPDANRLDLTKDIAGAVHFVHSIGKVIGNLHPGNVLIAPDGRAVLIDVGMTPFTDQLALDIDGHVPIPNSWPYKPAEEICPAEAMVGNVIVHTAAMDTYSFATTTIAIHTGTPPVPTALTREQWFVQLVRYGHNHLENTMGMDQVLWQLLRQCLDQDPTHRPQMAVVKETLDDVAP